MGLPDVAINIQDPGLGIVPASAGRTQAKLGVCNAATPNTVYSFGSPQAAKDALGAGPLLEAVLQVLNVAGGPVMAVPLAPVSAGTVGSFVNGGAGSGTITGGLGPQQIVRVKIGTGGTLGTATFQVALGAGTGGYGAPVTTGSSGPFAYVVPGQRFSTLSFAAGTYVANDIYTVNLDGTVTRTGTGTATLLDGSTHSPVDAYDVWIDVMAGGALGTAQFRYSLSGGNDWSGTFTIPSGGVFIVPNTGIVLTFAGTFTARDRYKGTTTAPGYTTTEFNAGAAALLANPSEWGFMHVVGKPASAAAAATLAAAVGVVMDTAQAGFRYVRGIIECPQEEGDTTIAAAFASFVDPRVGVVVGDIGLTSALSLRTEKRQLAWAYTARLSATKLSSHPGQVASKDNGGALKNVQSLYRDEWATPALDAARFVTARTIVGLPGYYITRGNMMASPGSDFSEIMNCRVMDRICTVARSALTLYLNLDVRIDPNTHYIDERDAQEIEQVVSAKLRAAVIDEDEASSIALTVSRTDNLLSTSTVNVSISAVPKGYLEEINATIGFTNPALAQAAA